MSQYTDCYFLIDSRNSLLGSQVLDKYIPNRVESSDDYPVPMYVEPPTQVFSEVRELIDYLDSNKSEEYSIYWRNTELTSAIKHGMLFYTNDEKIIVGFSIDAKMPQDTVAIEIFKGIQDFLRSDVGCIAVEEVPPFNSLEFEDFCKSRFIPE